MKFSVCATITPFRYDCRAISQTVSHTLLKELDDEGSSPRRSFVARLRRAVVCDPGFSQGRSRYRDRRCEVQDTDREQREVATRCRNNPYWWRRVGVSNGNAQELVGFRRGSFVRIRVSV